MNHKILEEISYKTNLIIDFGGGIKSEEDIKNAFEYGANMVTIGSVAVNNPEIAEKMIFWHVGKNGFLPLEGDSVWSSCIKVHSSKYFQ